MALKAVWIKPAAPEGGKTMSEVRVKEGESLENALKRFKRMYPALWAEILENGTRASEEESALSAK